MNLDHVASVVGIVAAGLTFCNWLYGPGINGGSILYLNS